MLPTTAPMVFDNNTDVSNVLTAPTQSVYAQMVNIYRAFISPTVALVGLIGNIVVVIVFLTEQRKTRFTVYCVALALTDSTALMINSFMDDFLGRGFKHLGYTAVKFDTMSTLLCKLMEYVPNVAYFGSSYLLICFSFDRVLTICNPVKYYSEHYIRSAIIVCAATLGVAFSVNLPMLIGNQLVYNSSVGVNNIKCETPDGDHTAMFALYMKVIIVFSFPTMAVLVLNSIIVGKLGLIYRARSRLLSNPKENRMEMGRVVGHFVLSTLFFFLNLPLVIVMLLRLHGTRVRWSDQFPERMDVLAHLSRFFSSVKDINYAVNFFLYFAFLSMFRWRFLSLIFGPCLRFSWFTKIPGNEVLKEGIARYERHLEPNRRKSVIATLAHQVSSNAFGVVRSGANKSPGLIVNQTDSERPRSIEMVTEIMNSESYDTHL